MMPDKVVPTAFVAKIGPGRSSQRFETQMGKAAKYGFGRLIGLARAAPVAVSKDGRAVVVVIAVEEFERLKASDTSAPAPAEKRKASA